MQTTFRLTPFAAHLASANDERKISPPADFPVYWADPADQQYHWTRDREHTPHPITPMFLSVVAPCAGEGRGRIIERYAEAIVGRADRVFNGYNYTRYLVFSGASDEVNARARRHRETMSEICAHLEETWQKEWKPALEELWRNWQTFDLENAPMPDLLQHLDDTLRWTTKLYEIHYLMGSPMWFALDEFEQYYTDLFSGATALDAHRLLQGFDNKTLQIGRALWQLSRLARQHPAVAELILSARTEDILLRLPEVPGGDEFQAALSNFLQAYGLRTDLWDWGYPSWDENPAPVFTSLKSYISQPDCDMLARQAETAAEREAAIAVAREALSHYPLVVRERFETLLAAAQSALRMSEDHTYYIDFNGLGLVRRVIREFGKRFVASGQLHEIRDVFYLKVDDVRALGANPGLNLAELAQNRRLELESWADYPAPLELGARPSSPLRLYSADARRMARYTGAWVADSDSTAPWEATLTLAEPDILRGQPGSSGKVRGRARVILSLADAHRLQKGDILVTTTTAPPWTPLFLTAGGLVSDAGGLLSHGAVVSREYRIPAVVGTSLATQVIEDGQWIEVDGTNGIVHLLS